MKKIIGIFVLIIILLSVVNVTAIKFEIKNRSYDNLNIINKDSFDYYNMENEPDDISFYNLETIEVGGQNSEFKIVKDNYILSNPIDVKIKYEDNVSNNGNNDISLTTRFAVPPDIPNQVLSDEIVYSPDTFSLEYDNWGLQIASYQRNVDSRSLSTTSWTLEAIIYDIQYDINPDEVVGEIPSDIYDRYIVDASNYQITDQIIINAMQEAIGDEENIYWKARKLNDYVISHIEYVNDHRWDDAPTVLAQGHGSCTEYSWLYIALCRAAGIPARYVGGIYCKTGHAPYEDTVFHRWSQIYLPNYGWIPVDTTWNDGSGLSTDYFGKTSNRLFATTISGGPSNLIKWNYNCYDAWSPSSDIDVDRKATWLRFDGLAPRKPIPPQGSTQIRINEEYFFESRSYDDQKDNIYYWFEWGDGTNSGWLGPYESGLWVNTSHIWAKRGNYEVKVKAKDINDYKSEWSDPLAVSVPKNKSLSDYNPWISRLVERFPILELLI
jgi:hypothetical protein